jgi:hypothetical protein
MSGFWESLPDRFEKDFKEAMAEDEKRREVLSYWCKLFENGSYSPKEFYRSVLRNLEARKISDLDPIGQPLRQGNIFSPRRLYLRLRRERIVFDICEAPFGNGVFVSSRLFDLHRRAHWFHYVMALCVVILVGAGVGVNYGTILGLIAGGGFACLVWSIMRLGSSQTVTCLDRLLPEVPVVGPIYDSCYHPKTFYRQDVNNAYREAVHSAVMQSVDEMTTALGVRPLSELERKPILRELYRR